MTYIGIDLAWSERAGSGVCVLDAVGTILDEDQLMPEALADWIVRWRGQQSVLAIDGPLVVAPESAALRPVERELHHRYGSVHAGPYPGGAASRAMLGRVSSPASALIDAVGLYSVDPTDRMAPHQAIEVFPAPTWIELFGLSDRIIYKRGRLADRISALAKLHDLLDSLATEEPRLLAPDPSLLDDRIAHARGAREWKAVEDILDARLCAYVALLWDQLGEPGWVIVGDGSWRTGYVVIPALERPQAT
jgi:predicted RNase H-like nuclease